MSLRRLIRTWDELGRRDPLWAVLSHPDMQGGGWNLDRFLETGRNEVGAVLAHARTHRPDLATRRALDFGCGVGRLSQALAVHFDRVAGHSAVVNRYHFGKLIELRKTVKQCVN